VPRRYDSARPLWLTSGARWRCTAGDSAKFMTERVLAVRSAPTLNAARGSLTGLSAARSPLPRLRHLERATASLDVSPPCPPCHPCVHRRQCVTFTCQAESLRRVRSIERHRAGSGFSITTDWKNAYERVGDLDRPSATTRQGGSPHPRTMRPEATRPSWVCGRDEDSPWPPRGPPIGKYRCINRPSDREQSPQPPPQPPSSQHRYRRATNGQKAAVDNDPRVRTQVLPPGCGWLRALCDMT
jgi:hypothetical protein